MKIDRSKLPEDLREEDYFMPVYKNVLGAVLEELVFKFEVGQSYDIGQKENYAPLGLYLGHTRVPFNLSVDPNQQNKFQERTMPALLFWNGSQYLYQYPQALKWCKIQKNVAKTLEHRLELSVNAG